MDPQAGTKNISAEKEETEEEEMVEMGEIENEGLEEKEMEEEMEEEVDDEEEEEEMEAGSWGATGYRRAQGKGCDHSESPVLGSCRLLRGSGHPWPGLPAQDVVWLRRPWAPCSVNPREWRCLGPSGPNGPGVGQHSGHQGQGQGPGRGQVHRVQGPWDPAGGKGRVTVRDCSGLGSSF